MTDLPVPTQSICNLSAVIYPRQPSNFTEKSKEHPIFCGEGGGGGYW